MTWHYQATHRVVDEHDVYEVREVHDGTSWTENAVAPMSETADGLRDVLACMLADVEQYPVLERCWLEVKG